VFLNNKNTSCIFARVLHVTHISFSPFNDTTWQKYKLWSSLLHIFPCKALRSLHPSSSLHTSKTPLWKCATSYCDHHKHTYIDKVITILDDEHD